eukprot:Phypoly_transcript_00495.p1 GENE.Phypoly_transcript_00495~~Phypoly_transcript_00495.p1  ORF type:complete len:758 (+),score=172.41 Phypoly_transcript_00495:334-2607(+)
MPKDTDYKTLKEQGKPCDMELHTSTIMPDMHKQAAFVRKRMLQGEGGASQVIFKYDQIRKKHAIFALVQESLKYSKLINQILEDTEFFVRYQRLKEEIDLVHVLMYDMLFGKGIEFAWPCKALSAVRKYRSNFQRALYQWATTDPSYLLPFKGLPRYARVNTIKSNIKYVTNLFAKKGYSLVRGLTPKQYADMKPKQFCVDPDIPDLLVFAPGTNLIGPEQSNYDIILQDKASCFSALALLDLNQPTKPRGVLDACAAPGNKTLHLAALLSQAMAKAKANAQQSKQNKKMTDFTVPLTAVEKSAERFNSLKDRVYKAFAKVHCINADFLSLQPNSFKNVTHILVDPSCSGSGMVSPLNFAVEESRKAEKGATTKQKTKTEKATTSEHSPNSLLLRSEKSEDDLESLPSDFSDGEYFSAESESEGEYEGESEEEEDAGASSSEEGEDWVPGNEEESEEESEGEGKGESKGESEEESEEESKADNKGVSSGGSEEEGKAESKGEGSHVRKLGEEEESSENPRKEATKPELEENGKKRKQPDSNAKADEFDQYSVHKVGNEELIAKVEGLRKFQITALKHAFSFPAVQRIVYSTCSLYVEENEKVVEELLQQYPDFKLATALPNWKHRGLNIFDGGSLCARASPKDDAATGFFVACFERKVPLPFSNDVGPEEINFSDSVHKPLPNKKLNQPQPQLPNKNMVPKVTIPLKIQSFKASTKAEIKHKKGTPPQTTKPSKSSKPHSTNKKRKLYKNPPPIVKT